jgi:hypothetical protein
VVQKQQAQSWSVLEQPDYQVGGEESPIEKGYSGDNPFCHANASVSRVLFSTENGSFEWLPDGYGFSTNFP